MGANDRILAQFIPNIAQRFGRIDPVNAVQTQAIDHSKMRCNHRTDVAGMGGFAHQIRMAADGALVL